MNDKYKPKLNFKWTQKEICKWNMIINSKLDKNVDIKLLEEIIKNDDEQYNLLIQELNDIEKEYHQIINKTIV